MANLVHRVAHKLGRMTGSHVVPETVAVYWPEQYFAERLFERLKPDCVLDVGANIGQYAQHLRNSGFRGTILSFEPNPTAFKRLEEAAKDDPDWHCYQMALGRSVGSLPFNVMENDVFSSFGTAADFGKETFEEGMRIVETVNVETDTLENLLPKLMAEHKFHNPFLKMDTQGFDLDVLRGAGAEAKHFCALLSEVAILRIYDQSPPFGESVETFQAAGFDVTAMFSNHPEMLLHTIEVNCYCVRQDLARAEHF